MATELCFYVSCKECLTNKEEDILLWILSRPFEQSSLSKKSAFQNNHSDNESLELVIEIGPRLNFSTPFSTNAVSMCRAVHLEKISRIEVSTRYFLKVEKHQELSAEKLENAVVSQFHDKMTQCHYRQPPTSFQLQIKPDPVFEVDVMDSGKAALEKANQSLGLAFDSWDVDYYTDLFRNQVGRNPTNVELFDLAQSNSEHSRHWFFKGRHVIDGTERSDSLFDMVMRTQASSNQNNVIKFSDNSSAICGYTVTSLVPKSTEKPDAFDQQTSKRHVIFTAETHNFPTGVAPFPGATTGTGGRIRDVQATGQGAHVIAGTAGYSFGQLLIPGYSLPWEDETWEYPSNFAPPLQVAIEASNGASDYGNKFGEPVLAGFARSFGLRVGDERREWIKPIMFSGGIGSLDDVHVKKTQPEKGMLVAKVGGPIYRIGVGGGAASSIQVQGDNESGLDFGAVQRGDAEMEQKMNRVIRGCIEQGAGNPIQSIHDQGAGGNGNVLKELSEPCGAVIRVSSFQLGDPTLSVLEVWGAEYQESNALLLRPHDRNTLEGLGRRERCPVDIVGEITDDGKIVLVDDREQSPVSNGSGEPEIKKCRTTEIKHPVDLDLKHVLGSMPKKVFNESHLPSVLKPLDLRSEDMTLSDALSRVLRLPSVASKRYLTNKVDRAVTGLVAQQQCVGPLHTPLADVAVVALSYFDTVGGATAIGEQPIKGLVNPRCGARMTVGEALTNLVFAQITDLKDVKCSGNWMWAAKLPGEGALLYDCCEAMCQVMQELGVAVDGGKDSLSMAARVNGEENPVKAPGTLVISAYVTCPDIRKTLTPDLKCPEAGSVLVYVPFSPPSGLLGGSALAQCYGQVGDKCPDMTDPQLFISAFNATQELIQGEQLLSGHDVSDGGLLTCILEMAFAGNCGVKVDMQHIMAEGGWLAALFSEDLGIVLEVDDQKLPCVQETYKRFDVSMHVIGQTTACKWVEVAFEKSTLLSVSMTTLRDQWEATSFALEKLQANPECVAQEKAGLKDRTVPVYKLTFDPDQLPPAMPRGSARVAVIREEGSNGDREMAAAFHMAGFEVWDVNMQDLCSGQTCLDAFRGVAFVGGFSYADVMGSAKGWAATIKFNRDVKQQFDDFYRREDTFSLGVCNGCQLMTLLGWVGAEQDNQDTLTPGVFIDHNKSGRFESRYPTVKISASPAVMLRDMEGCVLGVWSQHGEGQFVFKNTEKYFEEQNLIPLYYTSDDGVPTEAYPFNPNGSPKGIAGLCSKDGRHLAIMPHPERCFLQWQLPWSPAEWEQHQYSPWMKMFANVYKWCL